MWRIKSLDKHYFLFELYFVYCTYTLVETETVYSKSVYKVVLSASMCVSAGWCVGFTTQNRLTGFGLIHSSGLVRSLTTTYNTDTVTLAQINTRQRDGSSTRGKFICIAFSTKEFKRRTKDIKSIK